jgi:hypothetical protein
MLFGLFARPSERPPSGRWPFGPGDPIRVAIRGAVRKAPHVSKRKGRPEPPLPFLLVAPRHSGVPVGHLDLTSAPSRVLCRGDDALDPWTIQDDSCWCSRSVDRLVTLPIHPDQRGHQSNHNDETDQYPFHLEPFLVCGGRGRVFRPSLLFLTRSLSPSFCLPTSSTTCSFPQDGLPSYQSPSSLP